MAQVATHSAQFQQLQTQIVTISFVEEPFVSVWLEETQFPFPVFLDESKRVYKMYGLERSIRRSWSVENLWYYAKAIASGRELYGKRGDPNQLGGNFVVDANGIVRYAYPSRDPTDRPEVDVLLKVVQ